MANYNYNISDWYTQAFGRPADQPGLLYWQKEEAKDTIPGNIWSDFLKAGAQSKEKYTGWNPYGVNAPSTGELGDLSISNWYTKALGRPADPEGLKYWSGEETKNTTFGDIWDTFINTALANKEAYTGWKPPSPITVTPSTASSYLTQMNAEQAQATQLANAIAQSRTPQAIAQYQTQIQTQAQAEIARQAQLAKELEAQTMAQALAKLQMQQQEQARQQALAQAQAQIPALTHEQILARDEEIRRQTAAQVAQYQQQQALPQINIPQTIFPSSSSAAYGGLMPTELFQSLTPAITQAAAETQKYLTPEGRAAMEAETRTGLLRGFRPKYEGQITQSLGQLAERGLLGGTTQENILRGVTADLSQQYDKEILNRVQDRVSNYLNMIGGIGGLLKGTVQTAQESNPLAPYQLWADLVKGWLGAGA